MGEMWLSRTFVLGSVVFGSLLIHPCVLGTLSFNRLGLRFDFHTEGDLQLPFVLPLILNHPVSCRARFSYAA